MSELRHDPAGGAPAATIKDTLIVDTDVHMFPTIEQITAYMPGRWRRYVEDFGLRTPYGEQSVVRARWMGSRTDAWTPDGRPPGSDPAFTRMQLLDAYDIDLAILNNTMGHAGEYVGGAAPLDLTAALMAAGNEWGADAWLASDERLYMTMLVPYDDPAATLREIERWGDHPRVVTVGLAGAHAPPDRPSPLLGPDRGLRRPPPAADVPRGLRVDVTVDGRRVAVVLLRGSRQLPARGPDSGGQPDL